MKPVTREIVLDNGVVLTIFARLGTVVYQFFDLDRDFDGWVYYVAPLSGLELAPRDPVDPAPAANDAAFPQGRP